MEFLRFIKRSLGSIISRVPYWTFGIIFSIAYSGIITNYKFEALELYLFDLRTILSSQISFNDKPSDNVAIVLIDTETIEKYKGYPNFKTHTDLIKKISNSKNSIVFYNFRIETGQFVEISGTYDEKYNFALDAKKYPNLYFNTFEMALPGQEASLKLSVPLDTLNVVSGPKTNDLQINSKNPISRRIVISYEGQELAHQKISSIFNPIIKKIGSINGLFEFIGTEQVYINFRKPGSYPTYKFHDILSDNFDINLLNGKIVIVGTDTKKYIEDYVSSPYSSETTKLITTSELHANMFETLIENKSPIRLSKSYTFVVTLIVALLTIYAALGIKPSRGILLLILSFVLLLLFSTILLGFFNLWINLAHPLLTIFLCYYFFIPYRLIIENRRSWEYFQKNKLLHQVEELKTNFISMMSHDLKTPIARIQGMTEVILKDPVTLSPTQREAVDTIKGSSDDLLKFINSILQYGRIESQGVELHKQSKDINQLINDVIKKHEFLAKVKKIKVATELEPLFPVQIDVELMKQVLSNLVENAIKYSHEESTVKVKSFEDGQNVVIEVTDNGVGIPAEDLPNIFMKFYRSHNVKTSTIKGTGLGLYLAQYFAELHKGKITVTSEVGKGSTFRLTLPS